VKARAAALWPSRTRILANLLLSSASVTGSHALDTSEKLCAQVTARLFDPKPEFWKASAQCFTITQRDWFRTWSDSRDSTNPSPREEIALPGGRFLHIHPRGGSAAASDRYNLRAINWLPLW
jgi:hypothetical protein